MNSERTEAVRLRDHAACPQAFISCQYIVFQRHVSGRPGDDERDARGAEPPGDGELHGVRDAQVRGRGARAVPTIRPLPTDCAKPLDKVLFLMPYLADDLVTYCIIIELRLTVVIERTPGSGCMGYGFVLQNLTI